MLLPIDYGDSQTLGKAFAYLTRIGIAPRFGSVPIGYYQAVQCRALAILETTQARAVRVRRPVTRPGHSPQPWLRNVELYERGSWRVFCRLDAFGLAVADSLRDSRFWMANV